MMTAAASVMTMMISNKRPPPASLTNMDNDKQGTQVPCVFSKTVVGKVWLE